MIKSYLKSVLNSNFRKFSQIILLIDVILFYTLRRQRYERVGDVSVFRVRIVRADTQVCPYIFQLIHYFHRRFAVGDDIHAA